MPNTKVDYLYRDGSNYKNHMSVIIKGEITEEQKALIADALSDGEYFIPQQVGLPDAHFTEYMPNEDDHAWCELDTDNITLTDAPAQIGITADELTAAFIAAKDNWDVSLWQAAPKAGPADKKDQDPNLVDLGTTDTGALIFADACGQTGRIPFGRGGRQKGRLLIQNGWSSFKPNNGYQLVASGTGWLKLYDDKSLGFSFGIDNPPRFWEIYRRGTDKCLIRIVL